MKRALHYLRIGWTALFVVLCLILLVLWGRSYWHTDSLTRVDNNLILKRAGTNSGILFLGWADFKATPNISPPDVTDEWEYQEYDSEPMQFAMPSWRFAWGSTDAIIALPAWFVTLISLVLAVAPWVHWSKRFSLRTLLIAMTAIAVGLWFILWMARR